MIGGGWVIENAPVLYQKTETEAVEACRVWVVNTVGDECAIYVDRDPGRFVGRRDYVWWFENQSVMYWTRAEWAPDGVAKSDGAMYRKIRRYGFPFDPCGRKLLKIV